MALRQEDGEGPCSKVCLATRVSFPFSTIMRFSLSIQKEFVVCLFFGNLKKKSNNSLLHLKGGRGQQIGRDGAASLVLRKRLSSSGKSRR